MQKDIIKLSLCGVYYEAPKDILVKSEYFENLFAEFPELLKGDVVIPIYRSPVIFKHIISLLIDDKYPYPEKFKSELKFFLMEKSAPILSGKVTMETSAGRMIELDTSDEKCLPFGFKAGDRFKIKYSNYYGGHKGIIVGIADEKLWIKLDGDKQIRFFSDINGLEKI